MKVWNLSSWITQRLVFLPLIWSAAPPLHAQNFAGCDFVEVVVDPGSGEVQIALGNSSRQRDPVAVGRALVGGAEFIVRATALEQSESQTDGALVRFKVEETLKGVKAPSDVLLEGRLTDDEGWNPGTAPYGGTRLTRECVSHDYREGGQYLLFLRQSGAAFSIDWSLMAPVNERVRGTNDPWVVWVKEQLQEKGSIEGQVRMPDGSPAAGMLVFAESTDKAGASATARTDSAGRYRLESLPSGRYRISAGPPEPNQFSASSPWRTYFPGVRDFPDVNLVPVPDAGAVTAVDFRVLPMVKVSGRVSGVSGNSRPMVTLSGPGAPFLIYYDRVASDGSFQFGNILPGRYEVSIESGAGANRGSRRFPLVVGPEGLLDLIWDRQ